MPAAPVSAFVLGAQLPEVRTCIGLSDSVQGCGNTLGITLLLSSRHVVWGGAASCQSAQQRIIFLTRELILTNRVPCVPGCHCALLRG